MVCTAFAGFRDKSDNPVFPRWYNFLMIWIAIGTCTDCLTIFFFDGPFAYNGIISLWMPALAFTIWLFTLLNDLAWIIAVLPWPITSIKMIICGVAILKHSAHSNVFPRWLGYLNLWGAVSFVCGSMLPFFKTGSFALDGILSFWVPATVFGLWFVFMQLACLKSIRAEEQGI